jgi:hypothetical protein
MVKYLNRASGPVSDLGHPETIILLEVHPLVWASWCFGLGDDDWIEVSSWQEFDCSEATWTAICGAKRLDTLTLDEMLAQRYLPEHDGGETHEKVVRGAEDLLRHCALEDYAKALRADGDDAGSDLARQVSRLLARVAA